MVTFLEPMRSMKANYLHLLSDRDRLLSLAEMYHYGLQEEEGDVDKITHEIEITHDFLKS